MLHVIKLEVLPPTPPPRAKPQSYWLGAIASKPSAAYKGYILGGLMWISIPFGLATALGLAAVALDLPMTVQDANEGLVPPAVAYFLLGKAGAIVMTIMLFMAVTGLLRVVDCMSDNETTKNLPCCRHRLF